MRLRAVPAHITRCAYEHGKVLKYVVTFVEDTMGVVVSYAHFDVEEEANFVIRAVNELFVNNGGDSKLVEHSNKCEWLF